MMPDRPLAMSDRRPRLGLLVRWLIAAAVLVALWPVASAGGAPVVTFIVPPVHSADEIRAVMRPRGVDSHLPGVTYLYSRLRWTGWGTRRTVGRGRLIVCPSMGTCRAGRGALVLDRLYRLGRVQWCSGTCAWRSTTGGGGS